ncbi:amidohydrolase family protein [Streptomyces sp. MNP-20]|uniref:amidohydrolase family protein n=1 Tax=Streptomyces sp. MNP-20 TaxID=2721165 RepID=UPI001555CE11|nr:amidohydrolase family protein [Streptomyces sp. MNP-20]
MLITAGRVLTGPGGLCITDGAVLVRDGVIAAVGSREALQAAHPGEAVLGYADCTLMPGLIDTRVHLAFDGGPDPVAALGRSGESLLEAMRERAQQMLRSGVTTVRDLGDRGHLALRLGDEIASGGVAGPRIVSAGTPLTSPGGPFRPLGGEASSKVKMRGLVRRNAAAGARGIQASDGGGSQFTLAELTALRRETSAARIFLAAQAHSLDSITAAVAADVDIIDLCTWMAESCLEVDDQVLAEIVEWHIYVCPAIDPQWPMLPSLLGEERAKAMFAVVLRMIELGVPLIAGSNAGGPGVGHDELVSALEFYEYLGMPAERILEMATSTAAQALGIGDKTGRIAAGYSADLLVVHGNPLSDLAALKDVRDVFAAGTRCRLAMAQV